MNIYEVAFTHRGRLKKPEARAIIIGIAGRHPELVPEMGKVLALFDPAPSKAKTAFAWVAKAAAKSDTRKYLETVMCGGIMWVATDGARLHAAPCESGTLPGLYDPKSGERVFDLLENYGQAETPPHHPGKFPDWKRIVPRDRTPRPLATVGLRHAMSGKQAAVGAQSWVYESQWLAATERCCSASFEGTPHVSPVFLTGAGGELAVIMPLRAQFAPDA